MNFAASSQKDLWFSHPLIGDCSFDAFVRHERNPLFVGKGLWEWPVNGFLFIDPVSGHWYIYVSLYAKGYVPIGSITLLRSTDRGQTWEDIGPIFDGKGLAEPYHTEGDALGATDASVVYDGEIYHLVYGWGSLISDRGGFAYAWAKRPEGPFMRHPHPLKNEATDPLVHGIYKRTYATTLFRRSNDWLVLAMMSTPSNQGGSWALVALTAERPEGPYGKQQFLLYPQSKTYLPAPLEFYPAFAHDGYVYAPATSVGSNRTYQAIFKAKLEDAHLEEAWTLLQEGSGWHSVPLESERYGIWGQTFSGQVVDGERLWAMYPAKNSLNRGTINLASRPWPQTWEDRFVLSANNNVAASFIRKGYTTFRLVAKLTAQPSFSLLWGWTAPVGAIEMPYWAQSHPHERMFTSCVRLQVSEAGYEVQQVGANGEVKVLAGCSREEASYSAQSGRQENSEHQGQSGLPAYSSHSDNPEQRHPAQHPGAFAPREAFDIRIIQELEKCTVSINGVAWELDIAAMPGRIGLAAEQGTILESDHFAVEGDEVEHWVDLLPTEGLAGPAQCPSKWIMEQADYYRHGFGYLSTNRKGFVEETASVVKWNFRGTAFKVWMPAVKHGRVRAELDGNRIGEFTVQLDGRQETRVVLEQDGLEACNHALTLTLIEGEMVCDSFSYRL